MAKMLRILGKRGRVTIPCELRQQVGFAYNDILSFEVSDDGNSVVIRREKICVKCKDIQPDTADSEEVTLFDFLSSLSPEQKKAALLHLSMNIVKEVG